MEKRQTKERQTEVKLRICESQNDFCFFCGDWWERDRGEGEFYVEENGGQAVCPDCACERVAFETWEHFLCNAPGSIPGPEAKKVPDNFSELLAAHAEHHGLKLISFENGVITLERRGEGDRRRRTRYVYRPDLPEGDYFGNCPRCWEERGVLKSDGYLNINCNHFMVCHEHKLYWYIGSNLFSAWLEETEEVWERNKALLSTLSVSDDIGDFKHHAMCSEILLQQASLVRRHPTSFPKPCPTCGHMRDEEDLPFLMTAPIPPEPSGLAPAEGKGPASRRAWLF